MRDCVTPLSGVSSAEALLLAHLQVWKCLTRHQYVCVITVNCFMGSSELCMSLKLFTAAAMIEHFTCYLVYQRHSRQLTMRCVFWWLLHYQWHC